MRKLLTSTPSITVVGLMSAYLLLGFLVVPMVLKWQLEKQFADRGHTARVGAVFFDPLRLTLEIDDLALADGKGAAMLGFDNLMLDLEWRSIIDRTWTIADARLLAPTLRIERTKEGRHNFSALLQQFASGPPDEDSGGPLPRARLQRLQLANGRIEWFDQMLEQPLVSRITPLGLELHGISTLAGEPGRYHLRARTDAGEALDVSGEIGLDPIRVAGTVALTELQLATLARGLNRELALESPRGRLSASGAFDVTLGADGVATGGAQALQLALADLFVQPAGSDAPLLTLQSLALRDGRLDLAGRALHVDGLQIADAAANARVDARGQGNWSTMVRTPERTAGDAAAAAAAPPAAAPPAASQPVPAEAPWKVSVGDVRIERLALALRDAAQPSAVSVAGLDLGTSVTMQLGGADNRVDLTRLQLAVNGLALEQGEARVAVASTRLGTGALAVQLGASQVDMRLAAPKLDVAQGASARSGEQSAQLGATSVAADSITLRSGGAGLQMALDAPQVNVQSLAAEQQGQTARFGPVSMGGKRLSLETGSGAAAADIRLGLDALQVQVDALQAEATVPARQTVQLAQAVVQAQRLALERIGGASTLTIDGTKVVQQNLRLQAEDQSLDLAGVSLDTPRIAVRQGTSGAQLQADAPVLRINGVAAQRGAQRADLAELSLRGERMGVASTAGGGTELQWAGMRGEGRQLALARDADTLQLATLAIGSELLTLALDAQAARFSGSAATAAVSGLRAAQAGNTLALQQLDWTARAIDGNSALGTAAGADTGATRASARVDGSELRLTSLGLERPGAAGNQASLASATWSAGSLSLDMADGPLRLRGDAMALQLGEALLQDPAGQSDAPLVRLGAIDLSGAVFSLADRSFTADAVRLDGARAALWLDAQGRLNLLDLLGTAPAPAGAAAEPAQQPSAATPAATAATAAKTADADPPWRVAVQTVALRDAALRFEDRRRTPALALGLDAIALNLRNLDSAAATPMQVDLSTTLASGGQLKATGTASLQAQSADLQLDLSGVALAPVQPLLSDFLVLTLASGTASTQGRLTYGRVAGVDAALSYTGGFAVDELLLEEITPKRPFLAWQSVRSGDLKLTLEPNRLDIGEVQVAKPVGRLIIAPDQSINLTDVLKKREDGSDGKAAAAAPPAPDAEPTAPVFPVTVARVRVSDGQLEFADLSLRPQFGTRMHGLKGVITGLGTDPNRSAKIQLDARVDKFGSARIRGQVSVLQPEKLTDIEMAFRNLEMTSLSPYVAKFAGYEIASGRLSLDLQYKVRDSKLLGENKVVLNKVELGQKVQSPDALDLPLELALAILKDSKGVIDIGLPVSGDLDDPQFDYGAVIGKAIGNLLGGIVTAPFRALAAMFGGAGDKPIDVIDFEPGSATLAPPEQQKIETVARALKERPNLVLTVAPVIAPQQDTPVLQSLVVRSDIARAMGLEIPPGEDPGPIDAANPRAPAAVEAAFSTRYAPAVLEALKQRAIAAAAAAAPGADAKQEAGQGASTDGVAAADGKAAVAAAQPAAPPTAFYQQLIDRMVAEQPVSEAMLAELAGRRADAVVQALTSGDAGVPAERVRTGKLHTATEASTRVVPLKLELDVAK